MDFKDKVLIEMLLGKKLLSYQEVIFDSLNKKEKLELARDPNKLRGFCADKVFVDEWVSKFRNLTPEEKRNLDDFTYSELLMDEKQIKELKNTSENFKQEYQCIFLDDSEYMSGRE